MAASRVRLVLSLVLLTFVLGSRVASAAWPNDPMGGLPLVTVGGYQAPYSLVADGAGGFFVLWMDTRAGNYDIYAQHVDASGASLWSATGVAVATGAAQQVYPLGVLDNAGGIIVGWLDATAPSGVYLQRLNASGAPQWAAGGVRASTQIGSQIEFSLSTDGAGGALVSWVYQFSVSDYDVYAQRISPAGARLWASGIGVVTTTANQDLHVSVTDGAGGLWVLWRDNRTTAWDIFAQHLNASGVAQLTAGGINVESTVPGVIDEMVAIPDGAGGAILAATLTTIDKDVTSTHVYANGNFQSQTVNYENNDQRSPTLASDGQGGAFVFWQDTRWDPRSDIYGMRLTSFNSYAPGWPDSGLAVVTGVDVYQDQPRAIADGEGGVIVTWVEGNAFTSQIRAKRYDADGNLAPGWGVNGNVIAGKPVAIYGMALTTTGQGGAFCAWGMGVGAESDLYAQRIDRFGQIGTPEPHIVSARDVPNDQGGQVRVSWDKSYLDRGLNPVLHGYQVWRQVPQALAMAAIRTGAGAWASADAGATPATAKRWFRAVSAGAQVTYWEYAGGLPAQNLAGYSLVVPTTGDSVAGSNPRTQFLVEGVDSFTAPGPVAATMYWYSAPDSAYSVDNLPPALPLGFAGTWQNGAGASLHWNANAESDLASYRLYRGTTMGFVPSPANRIATPTQTWYADAGAPPSFYRLTAVDIHGNESGSVLLQPAGTVDVAGDLPHEMAFAIASANPTSGAVALRVDLPLATDVEVAIYDASGRRVREVAARRFEAGSWPLRWDGADARGTRVAAGLYFARMSAAGRTWSRRIVRLP